MGFHDFDSATTTTGLTKIPDFIVDQKALDAQNAGNDETYWYFDKATENWGYYHDIPEIFSAANAMATWTTGRGILVRDPAMKAQLDHVRGLGTDSFQEILWNHEVTKLVIGDAFLEVVKPNEILLNLIPISPERVRIVVKKNQIVRYDVWNGEEWRAVPRNKMIHSMNKRIGDQIHGTSQIDATKWVIDARNEALITNRMIEQRSRAIGIAYYKTAKKDKIAYVNTQIEKAVKEGRMLGLPETTVEIKDFPQMSLQERLDWIRYLENFFYQAFGVPRSIATSDGLGEVGSKMGHVIFEPMYTKEQIDLEDDFRGQQQIIFQLNRPPSLGGLVQENEQKNTGQINVQPNDVSATLTRE